MLNPTSRVRAANQAPVNPAGEYVLYWMTAFRRAAWNHSLDRAVEWAKELDKPLLVLEALRCDYPWASSRLHRFVLEGMADNARAFGRNRVAYYPYVEPSPGSGKGFLTALASSATVAVTDDYPAFFLPRMIQVAAKSLPVLLEAVESNGVVPLSSHPKVYSAAQHFRRFLHANLHEEPFDFPKQYPFRGTRLPKLKAIADSVIERWPPAALGTSTELERVLSALPIDREVSTTPLRGGTNSAQSVLKGFLETRLSSYAEFRNHPDADATSGLSPFLHFGHLSAHEILHAVLKRAEWTPDLIEPTARGRRSGWWGLDENSESFLDELITWRELGYNAARHQAGFDTYDSLPSWARETLAAHESDIRDHVYTPHQLERAETHDHVWNAAQRQLTRDGSIHGYLRLLWGKKILEWSPTPELAFDVMVELNNKYALDGRDPNSCSGIFWVLGKYDRPWGPERSIFGKVRYMSSANTVRKLRLDGYLRRYGPKHA